MTKIQRKTKETDISIELEIYGSGKSEIKTGVGFFDHMLESFTKHSLMDISISCKGDTFIDDHHSVEDVGICLGLALNKAIFPAKSIERFSNVSIVMDEACVSCEIDVSNRAFLVYDIELCGKVGTFDTELVEEFFRAICFNAGLSIHVSKIRGKNQHHIIEAAFKSLAVALRRALSINERVTLPSTKGML